MPATSHNVAWDFSPVFHLLKNLDDDRASTPTRIEPEHASFPERKDSVLDGGVTLGDFNRVWDYLGVGNKPLTTSLPAFEASASHDKDRDAYASDGALYYPASSKGVKWRDEVDGGDLADTQAESPPASPVALTKTQRKKLNRKARRSAELSSSASPAISKSNPSFLGSGDESDFAPSPLRRATDRSPSLVQNHSRSDGAVSDSGVAPPPSSKSSHKSKANTRPDNVSSCDALRPPQVAPASTPTTQKENRLKSDDKPLQNHVQEAIDRVAAARNAALRTPQKHIINTDSVHNSLKKQPPAATPERPRNHLSHPVLQSSNPSKPSLSNKSAPHTAPQKSRFKHQIIPLTNHTSIDRHWDLLMKLLNHFPEDRGSLLSPLQLCYNRPVPNGIHVFVDASNILIGFMEHLKRARGIPEHARVDRIYPAFHALALLLERRRPVARRVLAGSTPRVAAFDEAAQVGYDCCILDKVWKARQLTERQKRFAVKTSSGGGYSSGYASDGCGSGGNGNLSDTAPHAQQPKWVEQGVDEVLHLKILESIVDTPSPLRNPVKAGDTQSDASQAPTMVLATGDAAEAEYSSGFRKMVERALKAGWNVEVMAWGASISMDWRKMVTAKEWEGRFRLIELDKFAEELFSEAA